MTKIGITFGAFDLLHPGHLLMLEEAKTVCDKLIVGLHADPSSERPSKNKPVQTLYERFIQLQACKYVDGILPYQTEDDIRLILMTRQIDVRIIGEDYRDKDFTGRDVCQQNKIDIHFCRRQHWLSSSELRIRLMAL